MQVTSAESGLGDARGRTPAKAGLLRLAFWKAFWATMRPYLTFVSGAAGLVGLAFIPQSQLPRVVLAFIPLFLSYGLGQALTDCFQMDTDALSSPYRPLVRGIVSRNQVLIVALAGLAVGVVILGALNPKILAFGALAVIGLLTYTFFKRTWWGGPPWNSWIVALLVVMGRLVDKQYGMTQFTNLADPPQLAFLLAVLAVFFGYADFVITGYFKDISADRLTGYRTFPVAFGWGPAAVYADVVAALGAWLTGRALSLIGRPHLIGAALFAIAVVLSLHAHVRLHLTRDERAAHGPIANVVRAFVLYCAAIVVTLQPTWLPFLVLFYLLFEVALRLRPEVTQV